MSSALGPLSGLTVVDLSRVLAGPWATQMLADLGATVWKIEKPKQGDDTRKWGPPFAQDKNGNPSDRSAYFISTNRGKHSITIDFTKPVGRQLIYQLIEQADILIENFKVGSLSKYGLDYEHVKAIKEDIIYCSITGFGQSGPKANLAGYDAMIQAMSGLMSITGEQTTPPQPQKVGVAISDLLTGMYATTGILSALHHRHTTGLGQYIDVALLDSQVASLANQNLNYLLGKHVPHAMGNAHPNIVPYQTFATLDGHIMLAIGNDQQFKRFCQALGQSELASDPRFITNQLRVHNRQTLVARLQNAFNKQSQQYWLSQLSAVNVPCAPVNTIAQAFADPQVQHRQLQFSLEDDELGQIEQVANPLKFSTCQMNYKKPPPKLGADTLAVLQQQLQLSQQQLDYLKQQQII